uniref:Uncharacterized sensor-like histidine kinase ycf26 n=1 Tax=Antithamnion hubbsii TaxID=1005974 RepID=A0A4D6WPB3_9FLOR|nr:Drug sensory protein A [Antithamnion hubbsii]
MSNIHYKMRLIVFITLVISLLISSFTFWSLTVIQKDSLVTNNRFCKDLGTLLSYSILYTLDSKSEHQLASFIEEVYINTSSIRYILFFNLDGSLFFSLPLYKNNIQDILQLHQNLFQLETKNFLFNTPLIQNTNFFGDNITNIIMPLTLNGNNIGSLDLGISSNPSFISSSMFIRNISILIFVSIWLLVILFNILHFVITSELIQQLLYGMEKVSSGNFTKRIDIKLNNQWNDLIVSFNEMAERLEFYEKKNIAELILEKNKLELIVSTIADGAILVDTELRLLFANHMAIKTFNWVNLDIMGQYICNYLPLHIVESLLPIFNNLIKSTYIDSLNYVVDEVCINLDYDAKKNFRLLLTAVIDTNSKILTGIAIIIQDISREVQLNKAKHQFISNVSHELRTPLCNIGSFLETLLDYNDSLNDKQKVQFLRIANSETQRLSILVNDILDLSRLESTFTYDLAPVNLVYILSYVLKTSEIIASKYNINLILEIEPDISFVLGHQNSLLQIFSNLLSNAIKFTHNYGQIVLRVYSLISLPLYKQDYSLVNNHMSFDLVRIEIIDEGIGIDKLEQKNVFDRFVRIEDNIHTLQGTGLGLSIVKNILAKYKTSIFLQSQLSVGTSLWFDLFKI